MPRHDPAVKAHRSWLALIRPTGLVVAAPALARAGAVLNERDIEGQHRLQEWKKKKRRPERPIKSEPILPGVRGVGAGLGRLGEVVRREGRRRGAGLACRPSSRIRRDALRRFRGYGSRTRRSQPPAAL